MTLPNLPRSDSRRSSKSLLSSGASESEVSKRLESDTRYNFVKSKIPQFKRFSNSLRDLLKHYSLMIQNFASVHTKGNQGSDIEDKHRKQIDGCTKSYETAIEQLLEKAYQEAKEDDMHTRMAISAARETSKLRSSGSGGGGRSSGQGNENGKRMNFSRNQVSVLSDWFEDHVDDPYPDPNTKFQLAKQSGLSFKQVSNWFINARSRKLSSTDKKRLKRVY